MKVKQIKISTPGYKLAKEERETIIRYSEADLEASVFTYNPPLIRKLEALAATRPEEVHCMAAESVNGIERREYLVPKSWVKVNATRILSEGERILRAELMKRNRAKK